MFSTSFWLSQSRLEKAIVQPTVVEATLPVLEAIRLLAEAALGARCDLGTEADESIEHWSNCLAVVKSNQLRGLFDQQMAMQLVASGRSLSDVTLAEVIQPTVSLQRSELLSFETAFQNLQQQQVRHLPILESDGQLVGIITWESLCCLRQVAELTYSITAEIESRIGSQTQAQIAALTSQVEQSQLLMAVSTRIRDSLSLTEIFETTVSEVRQVLGCDRVSIYRFLEGWQFQVIAESIAAHQRSFVTEIVHDPCFDTNWETWYSQGRVQTITDIYTAGLTPCHLELLERLQMRAKVLVPIVVDQQLWGFISASESAAPRHWQPSEVVFLEQLGVQVAIAVQQGQTHTLLYQHRQELEALLNHAPDVIFRLDQNLHYLYVNAAVESELGYSSETIIGQDLLVAALAPEYLAEWRAVIQQVMTTKQESSIEYPLHLPDRSIWFQTRVVPEYDQAGALTSFLCVARNITQQKQAAVQQTAYINLLMEWQARYQAAQQASGQALYEWDVIADHVTWGSNTEQVFGYSAIDMPQTVADWLLRVHPDDVERFQRATEDYLNHQKNLCLQYRWQHRDGHYRWIEDQAQFVEDLQGNSNRVVGYVADITDRKRAELALQESEADFRAMFTLTGVGMAQIELKTRRFRRVNAAFCAITGYTEAELLDLTVDQLNHPDDCALDQQHYRNMLQSNHYQMEKRYQRKDGSIVWVTVTGNLIRNAEGQPIRAFALIRDISDRKQAEEALRQSEARYRYLVELSPQLVWNADAQGRTTYVSQQMCDYIGVTADQLLDFNWQTAIHPDDVEQIHHRWMESVQAGGAYEVEYRLRRADGVYRWQLVQAIANHSEQGIEWFGTSTDISDHKRREAHLAFLSDLTNDLSCLTTADEMMQTLGAKVGNYFDVSSCLFGIINEAQNQAVIEHSWHSDIPDLKGTYRLSEFVSADLRQAARAGEAIVIQDTQTDHRVNHEQFAALQIHAFIMIPFQWNGEWSRVFVVTTAVACNWRKDEVELIEEISNRLFLRLERARAEATIAANLRDTQQLRDLSTRLIIEDNVQVLYNEILNTAIALMQADMGSLQILDSEQNELRLETYRGFHPDAATYWSSVTIDGNSVCSIVLQQGERIIVPDVETCDFLAGTTDLDFLRLCGIRAVQSTPLINRFGQVIGIFSTHWRKPYELSDREQWFLDLLARQAADLIEQRQAETALRENEEMLRLALSGAKAGTWDWNMRTNRLAWSAESYHLYGIDLDRDVPQESDWYNMLHPDDRDQVRQYFDRAIEQRFNSFELEFRMIHPQLGIRWILNLGLITWNEQGEPMRMSGINLDITDRKVAELALQAREQRYATLAELSPVGIFQNDAVGACIYANPRLCEISGLSLEESLGYGWLQAMHPDDREQIANNWSRCVEQDLPFNGEYRYQRTDGEVIWFIVQAVAQKNDDTVIGYIGTVTDITEQKRAAAALQESEQKLRQVTDSLPGLVFQYRLNADGTDSFPFISQGIVDLHGLTPEDVLNNPQCMWDVIHPEDVPEMQASIQASAHTLSVWQHEYRIQVNGTWKWVLGQSYPLPQEDGSILWSGFVSDISDRKQLELALRESETQLRQIFDNSQDVFFLKAADSHQMIYTSPAWEELYQTPVQRTYDNPQIWLDFVHPDDRDRMIAMGEQVRQGHRFHSCEHRIVRPDGSIRWVWQRAFPIRDAAGQIYRIAGINTDITEQKRIEAELQLKAQIIDQVHDAVVATNLDGQVEFWNQGAERLFGYPATEAIGRHIAFVYPDQQHALLQSPVSESLQAQGECTVELKMRRRSGEDFWAHLSLSVRYNSAGEAIGRIGYSIDISDRKRIEAERRQAELELQKFAALADNSSDFIGICDLNFIPFYINKAGKQMVGLADLQEFRATPVQNFFFPEDQDFILSQFFPQVMRDEQAEVEIRLRHFRTGETLWMLYNVLYIKDEQGQPIALATVSRNITDRKQSELELQRREAILQAFMTASPIAMTLFDRDLQFLYGNEALAQLNNKPLSEHLGHTLWDIVPDIAPQFAPTLLQILETQEPVLNVEFTGEVRPGLFRSTIANHYPVTLPNGEVIGVGMTVMDVTDLTLARQELQESQEQLRLAFEASRMGTWDWNIRSGKIFWSANLEAFFGLESGEFDGTFEMFNQCVHPDDREPVQAAVQQAIATGEDYDTEFRVVHPNGRIRWAQGKGKVFYDEEGQPIRMTGVDFDITERKQTEIALRESEEFNQRILDSSQDCIKVLTLEGNLLYVNSGGLCSLDVDHFSEISGMNWADFWQGQDREQAQAAIDAAKTGHLGQLIGYCPTLKGNPRWWDVRVTPFRDAAGQVIKLVVISRDITSQKQAETALRASEQTLSQVINTVPGAVYRYRRSVNPAEAEGFTFISEGITALYGYTPAEILNNMQLVWDMILPEDMAQMATSIDQSAATLAPWRLEFRVRKPDGSLKWISGRSTPTRQENGDILWFGFLTDITDRKQIELALQESEEFNQSILDSSSDCIKVLSLTGEVLFINSGGLINIEADHSSQVLHSDWCTLWPGEEREQARRAIQLAATGSTARLQGPCPTLKGQMKWWDNIFTPLRNATGEISKIVVISRDITEQKQIETALRDSEQRYRDLAEAMPQMVWTADRTGDVTYFNQRWYDYTGLSEAESMGLNCIIAIHPDDREPCLQNWTAAVASSMSFQIEARFRSVDGDYRWFISRALPIQNSEGTVIQWIGTITDIHDRKQAEAALQISEQTLSQVINTVPGAVYEFRRTSDGVERFTFMSRGVIDLYECTAEKILRDINLEWNLILPEDRDRVDATVMQSGMTLEPWELEFRVRTPSGALKWILGRSTPARQKDGSISWFGFLSDITDRKRTELALQASEQRYINLAELSPVGIFHTQANGDCIYVNSRWCQLAGLTVEQAKGQGWSEALHPDDRDRVFQAWYDAIQFQTSFLIECRFQTPEGVIHWLISQAQAQLDDAGHVTGYIGTITDITERKQTEQALQRSEARLRAVFEQAAVGIAEVDISGRFIRVNPGYCDLFGYSEAELLERSFEDITPVQEELERDLIYQQRLLAGEIDSFSIEKRMLRKDKELRWCHVTVSPIRNAEGVIERCLGVVQDIHQRKQAELALQQLNQELELRIAQRTAALTQSEARYRSLFEQAAVGISRCDLSGRYLQVNQRFCELTGYTEAELLERTWQDITHPDDLFIELPDQMSLQSDQLPSITIEKRYICKNGQLRWVSLTLSYLHDQNKIISDLAVIQDISEKVQLEAERKQIELKLQDSEKRLREIISKTVDGILILDLDGTVLFCNPAAARIFGCRNTDCSNEPLNGEVLGIPVTFKKTFELEISRSDRDRITAEVRVEEITWQDQKAFLAGVRDISDRKQAERELEESELSYRTLAENLPGIVYKLFPEENNKLVFFNDRITTLLNLELEDLAEAGTVCRLESLIVPEDRDRVIQTIQMAIDRQESFQVEYCIQHPRTRERKYLLEQGKPVIVNPMIDEISQSLHVVGIIFDVTETKQAAEQLRQINTQLSLANAELARATRLKDEFLANMSHELRTPLNSVLGLSEVLQEGTYGDLTEQQQRALSTIQTNGQHLLELINDILDLAKIESGKLEPQIVTVAVQRLCQSTVPFIQQQALQKEIKFTLDPAPDLGYIEVDERLIRQVLINLLSNAVKFTASGGSVQLQVQGNVIEQCLYFHVIDTGIGIAPSDIKKLFQPFVQIDSSLSRRYAGTGLGLALVRRIVELHQGTVTVSSNVGIGSQFTVQLPWQPISLNTTRLLPPAVDSPTATADSTCSEAIENPVILLVDDNVDNVETLRAYLELKGFTIIVATNGKEAVQMTQTQPVNLILMDIQMPEMNGLEAIRRIRASESVTTPILAITALAMPGDKEKCLAAGANGYLSKPISPTQLVKIIYQHLHPIQS